MVNFHSTMAHKALLLCAYMVLLWREGLSIENSVPDVNSLTEPSMENKKPEDDEMWCTPEQVHLSYGETISEMVVMWATKGHCDMHVEYAPHPWKLNETAEATSVELEHAQENSLKFVYRAILKNLSPSSTYYFHPTTKSGYGAHPSYFKTPQSGSSGWSPNFLVSSNLDSEMAFRKSVIDEALTGQYSAWLYIGDLEKKLTPEEGMMESKVLTDIEQATMALPMLTAPGKKEGKDGLYLYRHTFSMPGIDWPMPSGRLWYSFDIGPVHLVSYSTDVFFEADTKNAKAQQDWLVKDLEKTNKRRSVTPWIIAFGQQPMYCSLGVADVVDCAQNTSKVRHGLEDMFYFFGVDLVIEAKHSQYERTFPQYKGVVVTNSYTHPRAPVEIIMGSELIEDEEMEKKDVNNTASSAPVPADWSAFQLPGSNVNHAFARLSIVNSSHLFWELLSSSDKSILDSFWLVQDNHGNFSLATLPHNISHQINQSIIAMGGKPGTYDFISGSLGDASDGEGWSKYSIWLGLATVGGVVVLILGLIGIRTCMRRRRKRAGRRWMETDRDGGGAGNFHSLASDSDSEDNDFEIDMYDSAKKQSSKLLISY